ncbi:MAG: carbon-monoxide dehydrogenase medium subunit [Verrucomicrobiales bacterium]|jgi:carbon-monoxide dehydrogenase medium subunit
MKPAAFEYDSPDSVEEALALLAEYGDEARVLAGGQSLVPMMNFRLAHPERLIDLNGLTDLDYVSAKPGSVSIGSMTRQRHLERSSTVRDLCPMISAAVPWIGHAQIRNRGTLGGSLAHADPAAELPVVALALDARMRLASASGERWVDAETFFVGYFTTALDPGELLVEVEFPSTANKTGVAFTEYARRHGDFGLGGAAALITLDDDDVCIRAHIALLGAAMVPVRASAAEDILSGRVIDTDALQDVFAQIESSIDPPADVHGSSSYRRRIIATMSRTAVKEAAQNARDSS